MAWLPGFAESFSQNDLDPGDPWLRAFLFSVAAGALLKAGWAANRYDHFTYIRWRFTWMFLYLWIGFSFGAIGVTNVEQIPVWHFVFTGCGAAGWYVAAWNYFKSKVYRAVAIFSITAGTTVFLLSLIADFATVAIGEWSFVLPA